MSWRRVLWPLSGRLNRKGFLIGSLLTFILQACLSLVVATAIFFVTGAHTASEQSELWLSSQRFAWLGLLIVALVAAYLRLSLAVRRLHDLGWHALTASPCFFVEAVLPMIVAAYLMQAQTRAGYLIPDYLLLWAAIVAAGGIVGLAALVWPGEPSPNRYGLPPSGFWGVSSGRSDVLAATFT